MLSFLCNLRVKVNKGCEEIHVSLLCSLVHILEGFIANLGRFWLRLEGFQVPSLGCFVCFRCEKNSRVTIGIRAWLGYSW